MNDIIREIENKIEPNQTVIMATSGGPDSMALLSLLLKTKNNLKIVCAHVNHKLRKESEAEAKMVQAYCQKNNIIFEYMEITNYKGNTENYARKKRYQFFQSLIKKYNSKYLLTAHHGDDLTETILMRIIRGSSLKGYGAFPQITNQEGYKIYRPLITKTKEEILKYVQKNNIPYAVDKTNESEKFTRNRIRMHILPYLKKENKNIHLKFLNFSKTINETENYFENIIKEKLPQIYEDEAINISKLRREKKLIQKKIISKILIEEYGENITKINENHLNQIINIINSNKPNQSLSLPLKKRFVKEYNKAYIKKINQTKEYNYILNKEIIMANGHMIKIQGETTDNSNYTIKINSKEIKMPIHIRNKQPGDKITLKGLNKSKKIKEIFINEKIPKEKRNIWPVVTDDNGQIIWLPGLKKSKFDKSNNENYDIIMRYF
ncbi:MAG: tRNA lysidine(34) synthetase TilS [Bacilli bacterium]|nr:tRNA lysidine(34) synthetase TilS [Bacilli bacterium]